MVPVKRVAYLCHMVKNKQVEHWTDTKHTVETNRLWGGLYAQKAQPTDEENPF